MNIEFVVVFMLYSVEFEIGKVWIVDFNYFLGMRDFVKDVECLFVCLCFDLGGLEVELWNLGFL